METIPVVLTIILTFFSPFVTAYFNRVQWSSEAKNLIAILVSAAIAVIYLILTGGIADWTELGVVIPIVYTLQQTVYQFILKKPAKELEAATTSEASLEKLGEHNPASKKTSEVTAVVPIYSDTPSKG